MRKFAFLNDRFLIVTYLIYYSPDDQVNFRQFVKVLAIFRPVKRTSVPQVARNTKENKLRCEQK